MNDIGTFPYIENSDSIGNNNMKNLLLPQLYLLWLAVLTTGQSCGPGQLAFPNQGCIAINFIEGCARYNADSSCAVCEYAYSLNNGFCQAQNSDSTSCCANYDASGNCNQCAVGLLKNGQSCHRNPLIGCIQRSGSICSVCAAGFVLTSGRCTLAIQNCAQYNQYGRCVSCQAGVLKNGYCLTLTNIPNCLAPSAYGCAKCASGFYLTSSNSCEARQTGCVDYWNGKCVGCAANFVESNGRCIIEGCISYNANGCTRCSQGLNITGGICSYNGCIKFVNGACVKCRDDKRITVQGCVDVSYSQCQACSQGFVFNVNSCVSGIPGCVAYSGNLCTKCTQPFQLAVNGQCQILGCQSYSAQGCIQCAQPFVSRNNICMIDNCATYTSNGCLQCNSGYQPTNGACYTVDPNCDKFSVTPNGIVCLTCKNPKFLVRNGQCVEGQFGCVYINNGVCTCTEGFFQTNNGSCVIPGCISYERNGYCNQCVSPYQLSAAKCVLTGCISYNAQGCTGCGVNYILSNSMCIFQIPNCLSYNSQGCSACASGFNLVNSQCRVLIPYCDVFSTDYRSCVKCQLGYVALGGACKPALPNCKQQDSVSYNCIRCNQGYYLHNSECKAVDPACLSYVQISAGYEKCQNCAQGYLLTSVKECLLRQPGCIYSNDVCSSCSSPFIYDSARNTCSVYGCEIPSAYGCKQCRSPFSLVNNGCVIANCQIADDYGCKTCMLGYSIKNQVCVTNDPNCQVFGVNGCNICRARYSLFQNRCVIPTTNCINYAYTGECINCVSYYVLDRYQQCQPRVPGCNYECGVCSICNPPFIHDSKAQTCYIRNCVSISSEGCLQCRPPFILQSRQCVIPNCLNMFGDNCGSCMPGYHLSFGECIRDNPNCQYYNAKSGVCQLCVEGLVLNSVGECIMPSTSCAVSCSKCKDTSMCITCAKGYFLNQFRRCEKTANSCVERVNGVCIRCDVGYFLYSGICFPYTAGCVSYLGKDCTQCRFNYVLKNGQCFKQKKMGMKLQGEDDNYNFTINPIDVRQSKYYIDNLSPASFIGQFFFSSVFDQTYTDFSLSNTNGATGLGWRARYNSTQQFIGVKVRQSPVTFYAIQIQPVNLEYITSFYLEYSLDGVNYIRVQKLFQVPNTISNSLITITFTAIYAQAIRIVINSYVGWPSARIDFFYYDLLRFKKITNLKSLKYLEETINSNFVDRVENQLFINQAYFFDPNAACTNKEVCFSGLELCDNKRITSLVLTFKDPDSCIQSFHLTYTVDGRTYNCYQSCVPIQVSIGRNKSFQLNLDNLEAQGIRIHPDKYTGKASSFLPTFYYS